MTTAANILDFAHKVEAWAGTQAGHYRLVNFIGYVEVGTTGATSFPVYVLPQYKQDQDAAPVPLVLRQAELGDFCVTHVGFRVPAGLTATNGNALKLSDALANAGATSATAANGTIAAGQAQLVADFFNNGTFSTSALGRKTADFTPVLYSVVAATPTTAGSAVSVAAGVRRIPVVISVAHNRGLVQIPEVEFINASLKAPLEV